MKLRKILLLLVLINLLLFVVSACSKEVVEETIEIFSYDSLDEGEIVKENDNFEFHFNPETTHFYVVNKKTGHTWYSNPVAAEEDPLAHGRAKDELMATLVLKYSTESGSPTTMDNYASSISKGNYTYDVLDDGIKVNYTIANLEKMYYIPIAVPESRFREFYDLFDKSTQSRISMSYKVYDINKLGKKDNKEELIQTYPDIENEPIYVLRDETQEYMKQFIEEQFSAVGYTAEEYELDLERYENESSSDKPIFNVSIQYELEEDGLAVSLPMEDIEFKNNYPIVEIRPLTYFGAGGAEEDGFLFVPDGSGALINFNNNKLSQSTYTSNVYGWDYGLSRTALIEETRVNFPVFGVSNETDSFICIIEEGSSHAFIEADVMGRKNSYNFVNANYNLLRSELMDISAKSDKTVRMFQEELPEEVIRQKYIFMDETEYSTMATTYREYLMDRYPELTKRTESNLPVAVELIGAVDRTKHVLGVPTKKPDALTTYKQAQEITSQLVDMGITDLNIRYSGWFNDGVTHNTPSKVKLISELGSKKDFKNFVSFAEDNNVNLYLDSTFQFVYNNSLTDSFVGIRDSAKLVNRKLVELYPFHAVWYGENQDREMFYLAKPSYYLNNIDLYAKSITNLGVTNIAFGDIGEILGADYNPKVEVTREKNMKLQAEKLAQLKNDGYHVMINNGNIYAVPYADFIVNVNLGTNGYNIIDEEVPFYEIALHGLVDYAGKPMNLSEEFNLHLLKTVETGAGLYFTFMDAPGSELQESNYTKYFSAEFGQWKDNTSELYARMKADFGHIYNQFILNHEKLDEGVFMTEYEDGTKVVVNYNQSAYNFNGKEVLAKNYIVEGGKQ